MMNATRKRLASAAVVAAVSGGLALPAVPAMAAPATAPVHTSAVAKVEMRGTAPACVRRDVIKHRNTVTVGNNCRVTMHLKVVIKHGPDSRCLTYQPGEAWTWKWPFGSYGKVVTC
ncbi:hypothetical protein [Streptomyces sp. NPDC003077]|uniref:hypothetical protein n=1 Tax=Streptomyces sp. NPDC003077 TaxID=3154443 RepID=UPI0033BCAD2E